MRKIKFSHVYDKHFGIDLEHPVKLIECESKNLEDFSNEFLEYDTTYFENREMLRYPLKKGRYLLLFFIDSKGMLFTTLRRETPSKLEYYMTSIGCDFELVIENKNLKYDKR